MGAAPVAERNRRGSPAEVNRERHGALCKPGRECRPFEHARADGAGSADRNHRRFFA
jgi:hypothetical protein